MTVVEDGTVVSQFKAELRLLCVVVANPVEYGVELARQTLVDTWLNSVTTFRGETPPCTEDRSVANFPKEPKTSGKSVDISTLCRYSCACWEILLTSVGAEFSRQFEQQCLERHVTGT